MRKKDSEKAQLEAQLAVNLTPAVFSRLNEEARVLHTTTATLAASYIEEHLMQKQLADYVQRHEREINSLTTELTRLKAALDFETEEVARLKATLAKRRLAGQEESEGFHLH